ncbi:protein phosphatase 1 regulatory subunit 12A isoform X3 [Nilaparvata lugens]|uniref:protein phosphatase 1 regulatory subunit 12A isoform X3 n=1 Tax=Nilaparvata lugens TaxID=108931 RepID=UPI00193CAE3E|nr:protein phosphatase 1 regulatory subunit 12A isoform X3 [Nilaparvata lugens]
MSKETRSSSALFKRAEQLKRYEESESNRELPVVSNSNKRIKFSSDCVFLAACAAGDKDEVDRLLREGADIDTANVDGLTSLHQACIDDNLDMVEFLVQRGADVNRGDNEGWTPLHATASCGFVSIAKYLIENGADVAVVNNDGDLSVDIADSVEMEDLLQGELDHRGINCEEARKQEERMMLSDAKEWLSNGELNDKPHPKTGATALHVAAAKGYIKVMELLLEGGADVNAQDLDGWTPLHAAAHWNQKDAAQLLTKHNCQMDMKNYVGQTPFDVAEYVMTVALKEMQQKQAETGAREQRTICARESKRDSDTNVSPTSPPTTPPTHDLVPKVKVEIKPTPDEDTVAASGGVGGENNDDDDDVSVSSDDSDDDDDESEDDEESSSAYGEGTSSLCIDVQEESQVRELEKKNKANKDETPRIPTSAPEVKVPNIAAPPSLPPKQSVIENNEDGPIPSWRRPGSFRNRGGETTTPNKLALKIGEKEVGSKVTSPTGTPTDLANEVSLRRTQSFEADEKFYRRYLELRAKINAGNSCPALAANTHARGGSGADQCAPHSAHLPTRSASLKEKHYTRCLNARRLTSPTSGNSPPLPGVTTSPSSPPSTNTATTTTTTPSTSPHTTTTTHIRSNLYLQLGGVAVPSSTPSSLTPTPTPTTPGGSKLSPGNIFKNFFKSFVPPVRDEESETQRKAHAKRVRETRRSTQGVTLDEIKSAEQLVKQKQQVNNNNNQQPEEVTVSLPYVTATITTGEPTTRHDTDRRPSWRLKVDNGSKFQLEDARVGEQSNGGGGGAANQEAASRRGSSASLAARPTSTPTSPTTPTTEATVTLPLRKAASPNANTNATVADREGDKENDARSAQGQSTQAVIQRRRRPKRRSTGVVHVDMDEIDPDRQDSSGGGGGDETNCNSSESGEEKSQRLNSTSSDAEKPATENGELDYKKLYEETSLENERLREKLRKTEGDLQDVKSRLENTTNNSTKVSLSEMEKRERRAMERKLSEMEEELKQLIQLRNDNQKLKDENGALIRVISKLSK